MKIQHKVEPKTPTAEEMAISKWQQKCAELQAEAVNLVGKKNPTIDDIYKQNEFIIKILLVPYS